MDEAEVPRIGDRAVEVEDEAAERAAGGAEAGRGPARADGQGAAQDQGAERDVDLGAGLGVQPAWLVTDRRSPCS